jgi:hypothetical protein
LGMDLLSRAPEGTAVASAISPAAIRPPERRSSNQRAQV